MARGKDVLLCGEKKWGGTVELTSIVFVGVCVRIHLEDKVTCGNLWVHL